MTEAGVARLAGFPPVVDAGCETLILGSFPGAASLVAGHYYAHPRNQFWPILAACLDEPLTRLAFEDRYARLLAHRVALWDVIAACIRPGSLDADIRDARVNDLEALLGRAPALRRVLFNGRAAGRLAEWFGARGFETHLLPSSSPAYAGMPPATKLEAWRRVLAPAGAESADRR